MMCKVFLVYPGWHCGIGIKTVKYIDVDCMSSIVSDPGADRKTDENQNNLL